MMDLKKIVVDLIENDNELNQDFPPENAQLIKKLFQDVGTPETAIQLGYNNTTPIMQNQIPVTEAIEESLSLQEIEEDMIKKALTKHKGKRKNAAKELEGSNIQRPAHWGGYIVKPVIIEFWQGRPNRLHDRILYKHSKKSGWKITRLAP